MMKKNETETQERILFSPLGTSDPIRNFSDGPCLHIARHYHPMRVVLYFTEEILREKGEDFYKKPLLHLDPHLQIECIHAGVTNPHLYDSFLQAAPGIISLPQALHNVHDRYPEAEILINVTSGTPQIQGTLVTLALQEPNWCRAIQVTTPEKKANSPREEHHKNEIDDLIETDMDFEGATENRCSEPSLRILRFYDDRSRIEALISSPSYEYRAAYALAKHNPDIAPAVKKLLLHATYRLDLDAIKAREVLSTYQNINLFPFSPSSQKSDAMMFDYFLSMQIDQRTGRLASLLLKGSPFLDLALLACIQKNTTLALEDIGQRKGSWGYEANVKKMQNKYPDIWQDLDAELYPYKGGELRARALIVILRYCLDYNLYIGETEKDSLSADLEIYKGALKLRNRAAHDMDTSPKESLQAMTKTTSEGLVQAFYRALCRLYGQKTLAKPRLLYDQINTWVHEALREPKA